MYIPNGYKICVHFSFKALQNLQNLIGIFGLKICHLATLLLCWRSKKTSRGSKRLEGKYSTSDYFFWKSHLQISSFVITELETRQKKLLNIFQSYQ
jgi:hypothetical protein